MESLDVALKETCADHKFAFLNEEVDQLVLNEIYNSKGCKIVKIPASIFSGWIAIQIRYASPYLKIFSRMYVFFRSLKL